jgi:uncharacterized membrane protein
VAARLLRMGSIATAILLTLGLGAAFTGIGGDLATELITAGLIVLVLTPVMRVIAALWIFLQERDWPFAFFSCTVLATLLIGLWMGQAK